MARSQPRRIPAFEWVVGWCSLAIVIGTLGYLLVQTIQGGENGPVLSITVARIHHGDSASVVEVTVRNTGRVAAADVHVIGVAASQHGPEFQAEARLDYVPGHSTRQASLVFEGDPGTPQVRIIGFVVP